MLIEIDIPQDRLHELCRRYHIRKLSVFGSALGEAFTADSDIDILVEFDPQHIPGLAFFTIQDELTSLFKREVDLNTPGFLSRYFRDQVLREAKVLYADS